jgi:hypothetical protein
VATGATCTFTTGEKVELIELDGGITMAAWRSAVEQAPNVDNVNRGRWCDGDIWTLDTDGDLSPLLGRRGRSHCRPRDP